MVLKRIALVMALLGTTVLLANCSQKTGPAGVLNEGGKEPSIGSETSGPDGEETKNALQKKNRFGESEFGKSIFE